MKGRLSPNPPPLFAPLFVFSFFAWLIPPAAGHAPFQGICDAVAQTVYASHATHEQPPELRQLEWIASGARRAFECYGSSNTQQRIRLLHSEVWALNALKRFQEARQRVNLFYTLLADSAADAYKAHFAIHRLHLRRLQGDLAGAMAAYEHARRYAYALPAERQAHVMLAGAHLFDAAGHYEQSIRMAEDILAMPGDDMDLVHARALFVRSYARLHLERGHGALPMHVLRKLATDLETAAARLRALKATDHYSGTLALLGEVLIEADQQTQAQHHFDEALRLARETGDVRREIFALLCRGRAHRIQHAFDQAENDLEAALTLAESTDLAPFKADLLLELGKVHEDARRWNAALLQYQSVLDHAPCTLSATHAYAREALMRVQLAHAHERRTSWLVACLALMVLLLGASGHSIYVYRLLRATRTAPARPPTPLPTRRLAYLHAVLKHPLEVADRIAPSYANLARRLRNNRLRSRTELYRCVGALEHTLEGRELGNPDDAIRIDLTRHFKRQQWTWPPSLDGWHDHFDEHPPEMSVPLGTADEEADPDESPQNTS